MKQFTTPCYIRKNTPELRWSLEELGYKPSRYNDNRKHYIGTTIGGEYIAYSYGYYGVDCDTNKDLFLALAALRADSDFMQWFTNGIHWYLCESNVFENCSLFDKEYRVQIKDGSDYHKATVQELIEQFSKQKEQ